MCLGSETRRRVRCFSVRPTVEQPSGVGADGLSLVAQRIDEKGACSLSRDAGYPMKGVPSDRDCLVDVDGVGRPSYAELRQRRQGVWRRDVGEGLGDLFVRSVPVRSRGCVQQVDVVPVGPECVEDYEGELEVVGVTIREGLSKELSPEPPPICVWPLLEKLFSCQRRTRAGEVDQAGDQGPLLRDHHLKVVVESERCPCCAGTMHGNSVEKYGVELGSPGVGPRPRADVVGEVHDADGDVTSPHQPAVVGFELQVMKRDDAGEGAPDQAIPWRPSVAVLQPPGDLREVARLRRVDPADDDAPSGGERDP